MVDDKGGGCASLVLLRHHSESLTGAEVAMDRVDPGEHRRRLSLTPDLPECCSPIPHCLRTCLALVD